MCLELKRKWPRSTLCYTSVCERQLIIKQCLDRCQQLRSLFRCLSSNLLCIFTVFLGGLRVLQKTLICYHAQSRLSALRVGGVFNDWHGFSSSAGKSARSFQLSTLSQALNVVYLDLCCILAHVCLNLALPHICVFSHEKHIYSHLMTCAKLNIPYICLPVLFFMPQALTCTSNTSLFYLKDKAIRCRILNPNRKSSEMNISMYCFRRFLYVYKSKKGSKLKLYSCLQVLILSFLCDTLLLKEPIRSLCK